MQRANANNKSPILIYALLIVILAAMIGGTVWLVSGLSARASAIREAESQHFLTARSYLLDANFVGKKLQSYIDAGVQYENKNYDTAEARFKALGDYRDSEFLMYSSRIRGIYRKYLLGGLTADMYYELKQYSTELTRYSELVSLAEEYMDDMRSGLYDIAAESYRSLDLDTAENYFAEFDSGYKRTLSYKVLINCRRILNENSDETIVQACYDALMTCLDFEDASQLILSTTAIAEKFLVGSWRSSDNRYYFSMTKEAVEPAEEAEAAAPVVIDPDVEPAVQETEADETEEAEAVEYVFKTDYNLPNFGIEDRSFKITDCVYSCSNSRVASRDVFKIGIISKDQVVFYCYYNGNRVTMTRQG